MCIRMYVCIGKQGLENSNKKSLYLKLFKVYKIGNILLYLILALDKRVSHSR